MIPAAGRVGIDSFLCLWLLLHIMDPTQEPLSHKSRQKLSPAEETKACFNQKHAKHEAKLPNSKKCLESVSCSERFMEFGLLNAAEVEMELVHGPLQTEIRHSETP